MDPARLTAFRQSLEKACRLAKPRRAGLEAFAHQLAALLTRQAGAQSQAQVQAWLPDLLSLATEEAPLPESSSPVCYAQVPGLREGFAEEAGPARPEADLWQALLLAQSALSQLLAAATACQAPEKQASALVHQLYGLSPEQISAFGRTSA